MRRINLRVVIVGGVLIVLAACFFFGMSTIAPRSNDPAAIMRTVGQVAGVAIGLGLVMMIFGMLKKR